MVVTNRFTGLDLIDRVPEELWMKAHNTVQEVKVKVAQSCLTLCDPMDYTVNGILQARILECIAFPFSRGLPNPGIKPRFPALQVDSLLAEPKGKPKNTGVGSLFLLQQIFPTQESNWGLLHYRQILYQLSSQGSYYCTGGNSRQSHHQGEKNAQRQNGCLRLLYK